MKWKRADSYEEISNLLKGCFRRDASTNNFLREADYRRELGNGSLWIGTWEGGVAFFRRRQDFFRMQYTLFSSPGDALPLPEHPIVTEIPLRPGGSRRDVDYWLGQGFQPVLSRLRLCLGREPSVRAQEGAWKIFQAEERDFPAVLAFLGDYFSPLTGCLPEREELAGDRIFCLWDSSGKLGGVLHAGGTQARSEICHLAVEESLRGSGAARALFQAYRQACPARNCLVWTGQENAAAQKFYKKCGFEPDGWTAEALVTRKEENLSKTT